MLTIHAPEVNFLSTQWFGSIDPAALHAEGLFLQKSNLIALGIISVCLMFVCQLGLAEEKAEPSEKDENSILEQSGRLFDLKVPDGFNAVPVDEPGILKWRKGSAEIYLVIGNLFVESGDLLFKALRKAAEDGKRLAKVEVVNIEGGKAMLLKGKEPKDKDQPMTWRLVVLMDRKAINVDFTAPAKDFKSFESEFLKALESFKLKPAS